MPSWPLLKRSSRVYSNFPTSQGRRHLGISRRTSGSALSVDTATS